MASWCVPLQSADVTYACIAPCAFEIVLKTAGPTCNVIDGLDEMKVVYHSHCAHGDALLHGALQITEHLSNVSASVGASLSNPCLFAKDARVQLMGISAELGSEPTGQAHT